MPITYVPHEDPLLTARWPLYLDLCQLPWSRVVGIYTIDRKPNQMPARALFLHPDAARAFLEVVDYRAPADATVSDIFRSAESSLAAVQSGRGAKPPGFSAHNYGLAVDVDIEPTMMRLGIQSKEYLDLFMESRGFYCHRRDHRITDLHGESHHFNFLGAGTVIGPQFSTTSGFIEARIVELYGAHFKLSPADIQRALASIKLYHGAIDGILGPISAQAIRVFRRGWGLGDSANPDERFQRTLAYVTAEKRIVPL